MSNEPAEESTALLWKNEQDALPKQPTSTLVCWAAFGFNCGTLILGIVNYHNKKHPLFMVLAYVLLTTSILNFRIHKNASDRAQQRIHYGLIALVVILSSFGIHAAFIKEKKSRHIIHILLGWIVVVVFLLQVLLGGGAISFVRRNPNHGLVQLHRVLGPWIYVAVTAVLLDGIIMKCLASSCVVLAVSVALTAVCTSLAVFVWPNERYNAE